METPEEVARQLATDVLSLRRRGFGAEADRLGRVAEQFTAALAPIILVPEHTAMVRSGKKRSWLRARFEAWCRVGAAAMIEEERHYRLCVLPSCLAAEEGAADADRLLGRVG